YGIGDLGPKAYNFLGFLKSAGQSFWQILPIGPTGYADSPYQCLSAFAGNPLLISPDLLIQQGLVTEDYIMHILSQYGDHSDDVNSWLQQTGTPIDYAKVRELKYQILERAFETFSSNSPSDEFVTFCRKEASWLEDFVLFFSLKKAHGYHSWTTWPKNYIDRDEAILRKWGQEHATEIQFFKFIQWVFYKQWHELKDFANRLEIQIIGDMPIFVAHDSADVWAHPEYFTLNPDGTLEFQAGVPPDYFSKTGQLWGNPLYRWDVLQMENFEWFIGRFQKLTHLVDWIRVDHFRGFEKFFQIKGTAKSAIEGTWEKAPGEALFKAIKEELGGIPIIAENLGVITPEVTALRTKFGFPGMGVLQFAFGGKPTNPHLPHNYDPYTVAYTGTHDNDTTLGWWQNHAVPEEKQYLGEYLQKASNKNAENVVEDLIQGLYRSVATLAMVPIQDILKQGSEFRMNIPSTTGGNWLYRIGFGSLTEERAEWLQHLAMIYGRCSEEEEEPEEESTPI
ncbi:MAG: 4-alpha-glucanotransferase, partial [Promethearchaeota archaeon]